MKSKISIKNMNIAGKRYGRYMAVSPAKTRGRVAYWLCLCACGNTREVSIFNLRHGNSTSCGCAHGTHNGSKQREYRVWRAMKDRCYNPKDTGYKHYGGRGVKVCDRWLKSYANFREDMGLRPSSEHSIDRKDNDGNYEPSNCRWVTMKEQCNNRRSNKIIEYGFCRRTVTEWAKARKMKRPVLHYRLTNEWSIPDALFIPVNKCNKTYKKTHKKEV